MGKPRQREIPGMEDREIKEIQQTALDYAETRDERMGVLKHEVELKEKLLGLMKKHKKTHYKSDGIEIQVVVEKEKVKVKVKGKEEPEEE